MGKARSSRDEGNTTKISPLSLRKNMFPITRREKRKCPGGKRGGKDSVKKIPM